MDWTVNSFIYPTILNQKPFRVKNLNVQDIIHRGFDIPPFEPFVKATSIFFMQVKKTKQSSLNKRKKTSGLKLYKLSCLYTHGVRIKKQYTVDKITQFLS